MKPQNQTRKEANGDCLRCCIATLLEVAIDRVPDFTKQAESLMMPEWYAIEAMQKWLAEMGLAYIEIALPPNMPWYKIPLAVLCILLGTTEAGVKHAIVGRVEGADFFPVFNPWPEALIQGVEAVGLIIPRDPCLPVNFGRALDKITEASKCVSESSNRRSGALMSLGNCYDIANEALGRQTVGLDILPS